MHVDELLPSERLIFSNIHVFRDQKVILDENLARMYGVTTRALNQTVRRNLDRFPEDFMFQLTENEYSNLMSQFVTSSLNTRDANWGGRRKLPFAFTEQVVSMLSSVLKSKQAISVNIQIMRIFVRMRKLISEYKELVDKIESLEASQMMQDARIEEIYNVIKQLLEPVYKERRTIGFKTST